MADTERPLFEHYRLGHGKVLGDSNCHVLEDESYICQTWTKAKHLGNGGFGEVELRYNQKNNRYQAVKRISKREDRVINYKDEIEIIARFNRNKYFATFFGWYCIGDSIYLAMEYFELGDLSKYIDSIDLTESIAQRIVRQMLSGLNHMHEANVIHRDLKPKNILVASKSRKWNVKIADFGLAKRIHQNDHESTAGNRIAVGTKQYMAPELLEIYNGGRVSKPYTTAIDTWAVGVMAFEMLAKQRPFTVDQLESLCSTSNYIFPEHLLNSKQISPAGVEFVRQLMKKWPKARPSTAHALQLSWIKDEIPLTVISDEPGQDSISSASSTSPSSMSRTPSSARFRNNSSPLTSAIAEDESRRFQGFQLPKKTRFSSPEVFHDPQKWFQSQGFGINFNAESPVPYRLQALRIAIEQDYSPAVRLLLREFGLDQNRQIFGRSLLSHTIMQGSINVFETLLELDLVCANEEVRMIIENNRQDMIDVLSRQQKPVIPFIQCAFESNNSRILKSLLVSKDGKDFQNTLEYRKLLKQAVEQGYIQCLKVALKVNPELSRFKGYDIQPTFKDTQNTAISTLVGQSLNSCITQPGSLLALAVSCKSNIDLVQSLLQSGADPNETIVFCLPQYTTDEIKLSLLQTTILLDATQTMEFLLRFGATSDDQCFSYAMIGPNVDAINILLEHKYRPTEAVVELIIQKGDVLLLSQLTINMVPMVDRYLNIAFSIRDLEKFTILLQHGCRPSDELISQTIAKAIETGESHGINGDPGLSHGSNSNLPFLQQLLGYDIGPRLKSEHLEIALKDQNQPVFLLLLQHGTRPSKECIANAIPHPSFLEALHSHGTTFESEHLDLAVRLVEIGESDDSFRLLLQWGCSPSKDCVDRCIPHANCVRLLNLHEIPLEEHHLTIALGKSIQSFIVLLKNGCCPNRLCWIGAISYFKEQPRFLQLLLALGHGCNGEHVQWAIRCQHFEAFLLLMNHQPALSMQCLDEAVKTSVQYVKVLAESKAKFLPRHLDYALENNNVPTFAFLLDKDVEPSEACVDQCISVSKERPKFFQALQGHATTVGPTTKSIFGDKHLELAVKSESLQAFKTLLQLGYKPTPECINEVAFEPKFTAILVQLVPEVVFQSPVALKAACLRIPNTQHFENLLQHSTDVPAQLIDQIRERSLVEYLIVLVESNYIEESCLKDMVTDPETYGRRFKSAILMRDTRAIEIMLNHGLLPTKGAGRLATNTGDESLINLVGKNGYCKTSKWSSCKTLLNISTYPFHI